MADVYDKKSHWHACKREVLDKRLKKIKDGDYSEFFDYSSDFWLSLCIAYFTLSYDAIWNSSNEDMKNRLACFFDKNLDVKVNNAVLSEADLCGYDFDFLKRESSEYYMQRFNDLRRNISVPGVDNQGMISEAMSPNIRQMTNMASSLGIKNEKITRNHMDHGRSDMDMSNDLIKVNTNAGDYELPAEWFVSYADALCIPERFNYEGGDTSVYVSGDGVLDAIGKIYRIYTSNLLLISNCEKEHCAGLVKDLLKPGVDEKEKKEIFETIDEVVDDKTLKEQIRRAFEMKEELELDKENVLAALLSVASINMFVLNYEGYFQSKLSPTSNDDLSGERNNLRQFMGNGNAIPGRMGFVKSQTSCPGTIRNCSSHFGRIKVNWNGTDYQVTMTDYDKSGNPTGSLNASLDTFIDFFTHPFFEKNIASPVNNSDSLRVIDNSELNEMFSEEVKPVNKSETIKK